MNVTKPPKRRPTPPKQQSPAAIYGARKPVLSASPALDPAPMSHPRVVTTNARKPGLTLIERYRILHAGVEHHKSTRKHHTGSGFGNESADAAEMLLLYQELAFKVANEAAGVK